MEYRLQRADGEYRWVLDRGAPRFELDCAFAGFIGSCVDITEIKAAREVAEKSARAVARANEQTERFLFATSHDLREPVRMVATYATLLTNEHSEVLSEEGRQLLAFVREGAGRLNQMVEGLNQFLAVRQRRPSPNPVSVLTALASASDTLRPMLAANGATLDIQGAEDLWVLGDPVQLGRVFLNLLANAVKFRSERPLTIEVTARRVGDRVEVQVRDNGIGFDEAHAERIFEMFQRLVSRDYEGNGIGLAICREIIELHGGRIGARSRPGEGATFTFTLPGTAPR
jgi:signal transduction histidine kinase